MKPATRLVLILAVITALAGCSALPQPWRVSDPHPSPDYGRDIARAPGDEVDYESPPYPGETGKDGGTVERQIIVRASMGIEVADIPELVSELVARVTAAGGFVSDSSIYGQERGQRRGYIVFRVPAQQLDQLMQDVHAMGDVQQETRYTTDVTEEYIDLEARITNLNHQEGRLRELLDRADSVEELLLVERELTRIRSELDSLQGRLRYLTSQVAMSTLTLEMAEVPEKPTISPGTWEGLGQRLVDAFVRGTNRLLDRTLAALVWFTGALPSLAVLAALLAGLTVAVRSWRARRSPSTQSKDPASGA